MDNHQRTFVVRNGQTLLEPKGTLFLSPVDQVVKAEILQVLHFSSCNYSFACAQSDNERFSAMFPDSEIAKNHHQSETKVKYNIQYGIAPYIRKMLIYDVNKTSFTFIFDETTTLQTKKQYDWYLQFWPKRYNQIINAYCGSLFTGHCTSDQLVEHYQTFVSRLGLDSHYLLHIEMDCLNVNLVFEKKLRQYFADELGSSFLSFGSCSLHPVHAAFRKGLEALSFDLNSFFNDIHFFSSFLVSGGRTMLAWNLLQMSQQHML